jgi:UDP-N-acetylmuramate dehydrogenase
MNIQNLKHPLLPTIQSNVSLKNKNWFNTGGTAAFYCAPTDAHTFGHALSFAHHNSLPITLLGHGANVLISDHGITGLVIQPALTDITIIDALQGLVQSGAGVSMHDLIVFCLENNLTGLEEFSGIPGSIGGSVYINLHYFEFLLEHFLVSATIIDRVNGAIIMVDSAWFNFGYNQSTLQKGTHFLIDATFKLTPADNLQTAYAKGRRAEIIRHREKRYPYKNTCGSFFRNFLDQEVSITSNGKKMIYVAYYLEKLGIKGELQKGDAIVSYQHANMIVNKGNATSADILELALTMQQLVYKEFGILPQPECRLLGFGDNPLCKHLA